MQLPGVQVHRFLLVCWETKIVSQLDFAWLLEALKYYLL